MDGTASVMVLAVMGAGLGLLWSRMTPSKREQAGFANIVIGAMGAVIGGTMSRWLFGAGVDKVIFSFPVALLGAALCLIAFKALAGRKRTEEPQR